MNPQRQTLLTSVKFHVDRIALTDREGRPVERDVVVHPGAVVILPILDDGRIVLIRNQRFAVGKQLIELPAGTLEPNEDITACAARELIEETGYEAADIQPFINYYATPGICNERMHTFIATGLKLVGQQLEPTEDIQVEPTALADVLAAIEHGKIEDAKTIATILYYCHFIRTKD